MLLVVFFFKFIKSIMLFSICKKNLVLYFVLYEVDNCICLKFEMKGFIVNIQQEVNMLYDIVKCVCVFVFSILYVNILFMKIVVDVFYDVFGI